MRSFIGLSLALTVVSVAHSTGRKSLGYGPKLPHARYVTDVTRVPTFAPLKEPKDVALLYLNSILSEGTGATPIEGHDFVFRDDSYTDDRTGVAHLYVRQVVNGIEVADGDINLNIMDGHVLSYGDSFYRGPAPKTLSNAQPAEELHGQFCTAEEPSDDVDVANPNWSNGQLVIGSSESTVKSSHINCNTFHTVLKAREASLSNAADISDPRAALLHFMIAAHPDPATAEVIHESFHELVRSMPTRFEPSLTGNLQSQVEIIEDVPGAVNPVKAKLVYVQSPGSHETKLTLAWKFEVEMQDNWYEAYMDAFHISRIHTVIDWASDAPTPKPDPVPLEPSYHVWAWGINDPSEGKRTLVSGYDKLASPAGWHSIPTGKYPSPPGQFDPDLFLNSTTTWGNNVFAHENWEGQNEWIDNYRPSEPSLTFDYKYGPKKGEDSPAVDPKDYINLTITQLFYTSNMIHDLFYRYGFDEKSGNFQQHNFDKGGKDGDAVIANAQDGSGYNNANFMTPPDGQNGRCRMYIWNTATPYRDGDLEAGIVIHELAHGLSTRLTGGASNSGCLGWGESGGMGEGWGDFIASTIRSNSTYSDYPMGAWAANQEKGIRNFPYSMDFTINPSTYKTLDKPGYWGVHAMGEVWAEILWVVEQKLIAKHGFTMTLFPPQPLEDGTIPESDFYAAREFKPDGTPKALVPKHGNSLILQLVIDAMKLQPCRPTFFDARDAILLADKILTGGDNACEIWRGFSERGLGPDATIIGSTPWGGGIRTDDFELPLSICNSPDEESSRKMGATFV